MELPMYVAIHLGTSMRCNPIYESDVTIFTDINLNSSHLIRGGSNLMIKRRKRILLVAILVVFLVGILILAIQNNRNSFDIKPFDYNDYQYYIENFSSEETLGRILNAKDAALKAETVWVEIYGELIKNKRPYQLSFDEESQVWLIEGTLPENHVGGVPHILIRKSDGKVLAVWHDK